MFGYRVNWEIIYGGKEYIDYYPSEVKVIGVKSNNPSITIPTFVHVDSVYVKEDNHVVTKPFISFGEFKLDVTVSEALFYHTLTDDGIQTSFPVPDGVERHELTDVYLPEDIKKVLWSGDFQTEVRNFHFGGAPSINLDKYSNGKITAYVPDSLYFSFKDNVKSYYSKYGYTLIVQSEEPRSPLNVNVTEPGTLATEIMKLVDDLDAVRWVVVTGSPNEEDLRIFRRMPHLEILDLSQVTGLKTVSGLNMITYLSEVSLPDEVETIGVSAFEGCSSLETINMPENLKLIKDNAFKDCTSLSSIIFSEGITQIGASAFRGTTHLKSVTLPTTLNDIGTSAFYSSGLSEINLENVKIFREGSFRGCKLTSANLASAIYILDYSFYGNPLTSVEFSNNLKWIYPAAFQDSKLRDIVIPSSVVYVGEGAFYNAPLITITVENSPYVYGWSEVAFNRTYPETIIWKPLFPEEENKFGNNNCFKNATLYVPKLTYSNYILSDAWAGCKDIRPMEDDLDYVYLDREYTLVSDDGLTSDAVVVNKGAFTVRRNNDLPLGKFIHYGGATFIPKSPVSAEETDFVFALTTNRWCFLTFPFDVNVKDIEVEDDALWVVRRYSGEDRANLTGNTWVNVTEDEALKAGQGYIFHCVKEGSSQVRFTLHATKENLGLFSTSNIETPLESWPSEFAHNAHWNLVGNSYPAYISLRALDFDGPVTVWTGSTYNAYSPIDDEYAFSPFQAFFVQCQETEGGDVLKFDERGRAHSSSAALAIEIPQETPAEAKRKARRMENRMVLDLSLAGENMTDRTRLVVNEAASASYESNRDAAKFMSTEEGVAQIFTLNDGQRMAIDERPMGEGVYAIGASFGSKGTYTISLDARNFEGYTAYLTDNKTNRTVELTANPYEFEAAVGTDEGRFTLRLVRGVESGAEEIATPGIKVSVEGNTLNVASPSEVAIMVVTADGKVVAATESASYSVQLPAGVYVVKAGETVKKIIIR